MIDRGRDAHVVRHHVHEHTHPTGVSGGREPFERGPPTHHVADLAVIDHVVAVGAAGRRLQDRAEIEVGDAQVVQVRQLFDRLVESELGAELQSIGGYRHATPGRRQVTESPGDGSGGSCGFKRFGCLVQLLADLDFRDVTFPNLLEAITSPNVPGVSAHQGAEPCASH